METTTEMSLRTSTVTFPAPVPLAYNATASSAGRLTFTFFLTPTCNFDDLTFSIMMTDSDGDGLRTLSTRIGYLDGTGVLFPRFKKSEVTGVFIPEGAQWTVKYGPEIAPWTEREETLEPSPEFNPQPFATQWQTGVDQDADMLKYSYTMDVAGETSFGHEGTGGTPAALALTSSRTYGSVSTPVVWNMEYYDDDEASWKAVRSGEPMNGLVTIEMAGAEHGASVLGKGAADLSMTVQPAGPSGAGTHTERLLNAAVKGSEAAPYDLSMHTVYGEARARAKTANCYIVSARGWYAFPLVYGNAVDDHVAPAGFINVNAYNPGGETDPTATILTRFRNCRGEGIRLPYIEEDLGETAEGWTAEVLWSDADGLIEEAGILASGAAADKGLTANPCGYVTLRVGGAIRQGNAVIAVKDGSGGIVWSWHIWVTDNELDPVTFADRGGRSCSFLPVSLGWVDSEDETVEYYSGGSVRFRITQEGSGVRREFTVTRRPENSSTHESGTPAYYQWGRKDPFVPGRFATAASSASTDIAYSIKHPGMYITGGGSYYTESIGAEAAGYLNLWSSLNKGLGAASGNYANPTVKTVYDPCPPGFQIPHGTAFTGLTATGGNSTSAGEFRVEGGFASGWHFLTGSGLESSFFAASGRLGGTGAAGGAGAEGSCWTSVPLQGAAAQELYFDSASVLVENGTPREAGCTVRPVMEQHL